MLSKYNKDVYVRFKQPIYILMIAIMSALLPASFITPISHAFNGGIEEGVEAARGADQPADLFGATGIFTTVTNVLLFIIGAISVIMIIIGGLRYVISGGDSANVTAAKNTILYAVVGVIVAIMGYAIVNFVITSFTPSGGGGSSQGTDR